MMCSLISGLGLMLDRDDVLRRRASGRARRRRRPPWRSCTRRGRGSRGITRRWLASTGAPRGLTPSDSPAPARACRLWPRRDPPPRRPRRRRPWCTRRRRRRRGRSRRRRTHEQGLLRAGAGAGVEGQRGAAAGAGEACLSGRRGRRCGTSSWARPGGAPTRRARGRRCWSYSCRAGKRRATATGRRLMRRRWRRRKRKTTTRSRSCGGARGEGRRAATEGRAEEEAAAAALVAISASERLAWRAELTAAKRATGRDSQHSVVVRS